MRRFFVPSENIGADKAFIVDKDSLHHIRDVLRLKPGKGIVIFDELGNEFSAEIEEISARNINLRILSRHSPCSDKKIQLAVACAIPKKSKMDDIIDKLTQLGVDRIIPLSTVRTEVLLDERKESSRLKRWRRISINASQQCKRRALPVIEPVTGLSQVVSESKDYDLKLIATVTGIRKPLRKVLVESAKPRSVLLLIGPEGDFADEEITQVIRHGFIPVKLTQTVLRVETAAIVFSGYISLYFADEDD